MRLYNALQTMLQRRGLGYFLYLFCGVLVPKTLYVLFYNLDTGIVWKFIAVVGLSISAFALVLLHRLAGLQVGLEIAFSILLVSLPAFYFYRQIVVERMRREARQMMNLLQPTTPGRQFTLLSDLQLSVDMDMAIATAFGSGVEEEIILGRIDQDGRVLGLYGNILGMEMVSKEEFQPRVRYQLDIVLRGEHVLLRKDFGRDEANFVREWYHLLLLMGKANVPSLFMVDESKLHVYMNFIPGQTMRDILARAGAKILDRQTVNDPELAGLDPLLRAARVIQRGRDLVPGCFSEELLQNLEQQLENIHACKIASLDIKYGNVIVRPQDGSPWLVDFENARYYPDQKSFLFQFKRDRDRTRFNYFFQRNLITERSARKRLHDQSKKMPWYSPLDFGNGLTAGPFWSTDAGMGRWEFINGKVVEPLIRGKRILDLGSNNGTMPLMMLRAGATEVVGVELSPVEIERADLIRRIFEWRDMATYRLKIHNSNMLEILHQDWGCFDVVTAFCSIYYLEPDQMVQVVQRSSSIARIMVIQANSSEHQSQQKQMKASVPFLKNLLEKNGFPFVDVIAPLNFSRPILVGRKDQKP